MKKNQDISPIRDYKGVYERSSKRISNGIKILGIETSCDDTGIAVVEIKGKQKPRFAILSNVVASQIKVHQKYGGVYPMLAKREHQKNLPIVLSRVLKEAKAGTVPALDAVAVTVGPGLSPCLWTGLNFAKELAENWKVPLIPVDHIEAHLLIALFPGTHNMKHETQKTKSFMLHASRFKDVFPAIALVVSGGHTQLILVKGVGKYEIIGETRDDAAGEAFDKTARILGLKYPGGPEIAAEAAKLSRFNSQFSITLPRPMMHTKDYDFSFSGLKTAVLYHHQAQPKSVQNSKEYVREMAAAIQQAIIDVLVFKTSKAVQQYQAKSVIIGGGVAANDELRKQLRSKLKEVTLIAPPKHLSTDNGAMIAVTGYFNMMRKKIPKNPQSIEANPNLRIA